MYVCAQVTGYHGDGIIMSPRPMEVVILLSKGAGWGCHGLRW